MIGLDTNVLVRYLVDDDPAQSERVAALIDRAIERDEPLFVPQIVLCEVEWVLTAGYGFSRAEVAGVLQGLLKARQVLVEEIDTARRALAAYESGSADLADYLIVERSLAAGCQALATFDRKLLRRPGTIEP